MAHWNSRLFAGYLFVIALILSACQSKPVEVTPTIAGIPDVVVTTTPQPTTTLPPTSIPISIPSPLERSFKLYMDKPILPLGPSDSWDSGLIDPGAVVFHDGQFHMFYDAIPSFPAQIGIGYATSPDGINWERVVTQPIFTPENIQWTPHPANIRANSVRVDDGTWVLYFSASETVNQLTGVVGRATTSMPDSSWQVDPEPILRAGKTGEWDAGTIGHVEVLRNDDGYVMYYSCWGGIGMATSSDGIHWGKYNDSATTDKRFVNSDPVMDKPNAEDPNVQRTSWGWAMVYLYNNGLNYAVSSDGIHWSDIPGNPIISLPGKDIWYSSFVIHDDTAFLYFEAGNTSTSPYLATWTETSFH